MFATPTLILFLLLSIGPEDLGPRPLTPPGTEQIDPSSVDIPWAEKTRATTTPPVVVELSHVIAQAEERAARGEKPEPAEFKEKGSIRGEYPPEILELLKLEALFLPPSDRIQVVDTRGPEKTSPITAGTSFEGIDGTESNSVPPDPELAVGPDHLIAVVNKSFKVYSRSTGAALTSTTTFSSFFSSLATCSGDLFDPNVVYDESADRFILGIDHDGADFCMAVSSTSDPTGSWILSSFETDIGGLFFDFPHTGVGRQALYVGSNQFTSSTGSFQESRLFAVDLDAIYNLQTATVVSWSVSGFTPQPLNLHGFADGTWPTSGPDYFISRNNVNALRISEVDDPFGAGTVTAGSSLNIANFTGVTANEPVNPDQPTGDRIDAGDSRPLDFEYRNGYGWTVQNVSCNPGSGLVNCIRWAQIDLENQSIEDAGITSFGLRYALFPDLAVNKCNDVLIGFSIVSDSIYPASAIIGRQSDDAAGTLDDDSYSVETTGVEYDAFDGSPLRWGDYTGATIAPDGLSLWYLGQYSKDINDNSNWGTFAREYTFPDSDDDDVPDSCDVCPGFIDASDADDDGTPDGCDACPGQDDAIFNVDGDAYCDDVDICLLGDDDLDADGDGTPDACDPCTGPDNVDADGDGVCDSVDICLGDDATGDADADMRCADLDCNDNDASAQDDDRCQVCAGDGTSCVALFAIGNEFVVASTTASDQSAPSVSAGPDGFLVTWTSDDSDAEGIRGRLFTSDGSASGADFSLNQTTAGSQDQSATATLDSGGYIVAWQSDNVDGDRAGIAGRFVNGATLGSELLLNSSSAGAQLFPALAPDATGFQAVWQSATFDVDGDGIAERRFLSDGSPVGNDFALTGTNSQTVPDVAALPAGSLVTWIDDSTGVRVQLLDASGTPVGSDVEADPDGQSAAVAADDAGESFVTWADPDGDGTSNAAVFAQLFDSTGQTVDGRKRVSPSANNDQEAPDVAALGSGGFVVVYEDQNTGDVRAQLYESDGSAGVTGITGALVDSDPFAVNENGSTVATEPAVAVDDNGTFFVVWTDSTIDGSGSGIAGRLFGTDVDVDGIAGAADNCPLDANADQADTDNDGEGDVCDACPTGDNSIDDDGDGVIDGCDLCFGVDNVDADGDGVCDSVDICEGDDNLGDADGDGFCADTDCDDNDGNAQELDRCGLCAGAGDSCLALFPIGSEFQVNTTTLVVQYAPSIAAGEDGFLVTWTNDGTSIRGRSFSPDGTAQGDDFAVSTGTVGEYPSTAALADGSYIVAWKSTDADGDGIAARFVESGAAVGSEFAVNSETDDDQQYPSVAPSSSGFQAVWQSFGQDGDGDGVALRRFLADGTPEGADAALTGTGEQRLPDIAAMPSGALTIWIDESSGIRSQLLDASGATVGSEIQLDSASGTSTAVAADSSGGALVAWADKDGDGTDDAAVFARRVDPAGQANGAAFRVSPSGNNNQHQPDVAALPDGGFLVVYRNDSDRFIHAQLYESDGSPGVPGIPGALVGSDPFMVNENSSAVTTQPAVAVHADGTFFVVWSDNRIDGLSLGIAGRLFGTDEDADDIAGAVDNCPLDSNADQADADSDDRGDVCDNCPAVANADQADADSDELGDVCDNCPDDANADQADADLDGSGDICDPCTDTDGDGAGNPGFDANTCPTDNCPDVANPDFADADIDGMGDACDDCTDTDGDGSGDPGFVNNTCATDNCPDDANADQADSDLDGVGDVCDVCLGDDATGDGDGDDVCADQDCDDGDAGAQSVDLCGVCGGANACAIFIDDFETGDVSLWSGSAP